MKLKVFLVFVVLALAGIGEINQSYANSLIFCSDTAPSYSYYEKEDAPQKHDVLYVDSSQIHALPEGLFVEIEGMLYPINALYFSDNGYYIPYVGWWTCKNGHLNAPWLTYCPLCGDRRP